MNKKKKYKLDIDDDFIDFEIIGLCSHHSDYRLVWSLNGNIGLRLEKCAEDYPLMNKKGEVDSLHPMYYYPDVEDRTDFYLIRNNADGKYLIPEKPSIDFFLFLNHNVGVDTDELIEKLRNVPSVLGVYLFDPDELDSVHNIEFN